MHQPTRPLVQAARPGRSPAPASSPRGGHPEPLPFTACRLLSIWPNNSPGQEHHGAAPRLRRPCCSPADAATSAASAGGGRPAEGPAPEPGHVWTRTSRWSRQELQERVRPAASSIGLHLANIPAHAGVSPRGRTRLVGAPAARCRARLAGLDAFLRRRPISPGLHASRPVSTIVTKADSTSIVQAGKRV